MIRAFLFDLGNVLFPFDFTSVIHFLTKNGARLKNLQTLKKLLREYETGRISTPEFYGKMKDLTGYTGTFENFRKNFSDIFVENPDTLNLIPRIRQKYPVYLLSNTNEMHFHHLMETSPLLRELDGYLLSYEAGIMKPDPLIFQKAIERFDLEPGSTLFIDDLADNIHSAAKCGFLTFHYIFKDGKPKKPLQDALTSYNVSLL